MSDPLEKQEGDGADQVDGTAEHSEAATTDAADNAEATTDGGAAEAATTDAAEATTDAADNAEAKGEDEK